MQRTTNQMMRLAAMGVIAIACLGATPAHAGPVGYWTFDTSGGFFNDSSGYGHTGSAISQSTGDGFDNTTSALGGGSARFNGNDGGAQFQFVLPGAIDPLMTNQGTISLWVKRDTANPVNDGNSGLMDLSIAGNEATHYPYSDGVGYIGEFRQNRVNGIALPGGVDRTEWHHLAIVADTSGGAGASRYQVYVDGVAIYTNLTDTFTFTYGDTFGGVARLGMSHATDVSGRGYVGNLDDVSLFNWALSSADIAALAAGVSPLQVPAPAAMPAGLALMLGLAARRRRCRG